MAEVAVERTIGGIDCLVNSPAKPVARLVLAHGAGAPMDSSFMNIMAARLCERAVAVIRFEFPYMAQRRASGRKAPPNRQPVLLQTWHTLLSALTEEEGAPLCVGGKSMGGRMATLSMAEQPLEAVRAVICLGYPFHPPGKPDKLRTEHFSRIPVPVLVLQGTRDTMGKREEVAGYGLPEPVTVEWLETANHDLKPLVKSGYSHDAYLAKAADHVVGFLEQHLR